MAVADLGIRRVSDASAEAPASTATAPAVEMVAEPVAEASAEPQPVAEPAAEPAAEEPAAEEPAAEEPRFQGPHAQLQRVVHRSAGIYQNKTLSRLRGAHRTVLVVNGDASYAALLFNWVCFARRLGLRFMLASTDDLLHRHVQKHQAEMGFLSYVPNRNGHLGGRWSKGKYHRLAVLTFKLVVVRDIMLHTGFNVLFSDVDIALLADPWWPHVANSVRIEGCDYIYQQNPHFCCPPDFGCGFSKSYDGNTGFYFARSRSRPLLTFFDQIIRAAQKDHQHHDQRLWWDRLHASLQPGQDGGFLYHDTTANWRAYVAAGRAKKRTRLESTATKLLVCPLPALTHINGGMLYQDTNKTKVELRAQRSTPFGLAHPELLAPVMVHANYRTPPSLGIKIEQLLEKGLWALRETPGWETLVGQTKVARRSMETFTPMAAVKSFANTPQRLQHVPTPKCLPIEDLPYFKPGGFEYATQPPAAAAAAAAAATVAPPKGWRSNEAYFGECARSARSSYPDKAAASRNWTAVSLGEGGPLEALNGGAGSAPDAPTKNDAPPPEGSLVSPPNSAPPRRRCAETDTVYPKKAAAVAAAAAAPKENPKNRIGALATSNGGWPTGLMEFLPDCGRSSPERAWPRGTLRELIQLRNESK